MNFEDILGSVEVNQLLTEIGAEIAEFAPIPGGYTQTQALALGVKLQEVGAQMSTSDVSRKQIIGGYLSWVGAALETGTPPPLPEYSAETWTRAGFEMGSGALLAAVSTKLGAAIAFAGVAYFVGGSINAYILLGAAAAAWPITMFIGGVAIWIGLRVAFSDLANGIGDFLFDDIASPLLQLFRDPLVLDLDGDGIEVTPLDGSSVHFDYDGDGFAERTGWVAADDGMLAIDLNGNGMVDGAVEFFGSPTQDGFAVLETLDSNGDGGNFTRPTRRYAQHLAAASLVDCDRRFQACC